MSCYHEAERKAGHTDAEIEEHGDMVLMTWRDWKNLREKLSEMREEAHTSHPSLTAQELNGFRFALWEVMRTMDETPV